MNVDRATSLPIDSARFEQVRHEWLWITTRPPVDPARFETVKREAETLVAAGRWVSGPADMLSVLRRHRDELTHSRLIAWLLVPTNRHGLGRAVLTGFLDALWPEEQLMRIGPVTADLEVPASGIDVVGEEHEARADIVLRSGGMTIVIENKVDAGEGWRQAERLYWSWTWGAVDTRWVLLTPTGRPAESAVSNEARAAWHTMSYRQFRDIMKAAIERAEPTTSIGRATANQYLETLTRHLAQP